MSEAETSELDYVETATTTDGIDLDVLNLIGIFGTENDRRALVRHSTGRVQKVAMGARVGGAKVVAIGKDSLFLKAGSSTHKLEMPIG